MMLVKASHNSTKGVVNNYGCGGVEMFHDGKHFHVTHQMHGQFCNPLLNV